MALFPSNGGELKPGRILSQIQTPNGYLKVGLYKHGGNKSVQKSVHSIVLESFKGPRTGKQVCRHLDGIRTHNTPKNLEWGTGKQNAQDSKGHGTFVIGEKNGFSVLTKDDVVKIRNMREEGETLKSIGLKFNTHLSNVSLICRGKAWNHVT
jgi:hypothetical protein